VEFTSTDIVDPVWNSGERSPWLTIFEREKVLGSPGKSEFGCEHVNHFVAGFRGMMENDEAVQRIYDDMILVVFNFCWKEFIDFFLVIKEFSGVEPRFRRVGGVGVFIKSKGFQNRMPGPNESPWKRRGVTGDSRSH